MTRWDDPSRPSPGVRRQDVQCAGTLQGLLAFEEEAVIGIARINEAYDDRPSRVDVTGEGALGLGLCPRQGRQTW